MDQITVRIWRYTRTQTSRKFRFYSVSLRGWYRSTLKRSSTWNRLKVHRPHGRDLHCLMIKWSGERKQQLMFTQILFYVWEDVRAQRSKPKMGRSSDRFSVDRFLRRVTGIRWRTNWVQVGYFPGLTSLGILQNDLQERNIEPEQFGDRIIFMSTFNDINWTRKRNEEICLSNSQKVKMYAKRFS